MPFPRLNRVRALRNYDMVAAVFADEADAGQVESTVGPHRVWGERNGSVDG